jgi:hypothetical protein
MSNVLKRIQAINAAKKAQTPVAQSQAIADKYIADIKEETRKEVEEELREQLVNAALQAELEGVKLESAALRSEVNIVKELLTNERSQVVQLSDLIKSLKADEKNKSIAHEEQKKEHEIAMKGLSEKIISLELALIEERSKPPPALQLIKPEARIAPSSFKVTHVRGADNRIMESKVEPVYERPN